VTTAEDDLTTRIRVHVSEYEKYPFYSVRFREDLEEWEDDDDFEPNAELTAEEVADYRRVQAEHVAWQEKLSGMHDTVRLREARRNAAVAAVLRTGLHLVIVRQDGNEDRVVPEVSEDGSTWSYLVPEGVTMAGGHPVTAGDTVSGRIEVSAW
jgi:hypothetical protein